MTVKILDLFAGGGFLSLGFEMVKDKTGKSVFEVHRAVEIDKYACQTLRARHSDETVIEGDLTDKKIHDRVIKECKNKVSIIMGGIPCQSFSYIGPRSGSGKKNEKFRKDERDNLYREFRDIVDKIRPNIILIENVKGILTKKDEKGKKIIDKIFRDFEKLGYNFRNNKNGQKYMLLNAVHFGVPQKRERVIILGIKKEWKNIDVPYIEPTHEKPVTIFEAIGDLPEVNAKITNTGLTERKIKEIKKKNEKINSGTEKISFNKKLFNEHLSLISDQGRDFLQIMRPNGYKYIDYHITRSQQVSDLKLFRMLKEGETAADFIKREPKKAEKLIKYDMNSFKDKYRRQKYDEPSTTIFAHLEKDGNRFIHPVQPRTITPREAARIQSIPDEVPIEGPLSKKFRQIGNGVPTRMAFEIGNIVYKDLIK